MSRRIIVTGGAGFLGSRIVRHHVDRGDVVTIVDNMSTGQISELTAGAHVYSMGVERMLDFQGEIVYHFASPASPDVFVSDWEAVVRANVHGTMRAVEAVVPGGLLVLASSSEIYGQPTEPMQEQCLGSVRTQSVRGVYDEGKRLAEAIVHNATMRDGIRALTCRIFNTYGPGMPDDGRVINTFVRQALTGQPLTVHGDGSQKRSFGYVDDTIRQILGAVDWMIDREPDRRRLVLNVGTPVERSVGAAAEIVCELVQAEIKFVPSPRPDDPRWRMPVIDRVVEILGQQTYVSLNEGIARTIEHHRRHGF